MTTLTTPPIELQRELITKLQDELAAITYLNQLKIEVLNAQTPADLAGEQYRKDQIAELTLGIENAQKSIELLEKKLSTLPRPTTSRFPVPLQ